MSPTKRTDYHKVDGGPDNSQGASSKPVKRKSVSLRKVVPAVKSVPQIQNAPSVDKAEEDALEEYVQAASEKNGTSKAKKRKSVSLRKTVPKVKVVPQIQKAPALDDAPQRKTNGFRAYPGGHVPPPGIAASSVGVGTSAYVGASVGVGASGGAGAGVNAGAAGQGTSPAAAWNGTAQTPQNAGPFVQGAAGQGEVNVAPGYDVAAYGADVPGEQEPIQNQGKRRSVASGNTVEELQSKGELHRARGSNVGWIIATIVLLAVAASAFWFYWQEWMCYDDMQDIQGTWIVAATGASIVIDDETIRIANDAAYAYEMDTKEKTLSFSFLKLSGQARYRFGGDRASFAVIEGMETSKNQMIWEDFLWQVRVAWAQLTKSELPDPSADFEPSETVTVTLFVRHLPQKAA